MEDAEAAIGDSFPQGHGGYEFMEEDGGYVEFYVYQIRSGIIVWSGKVLMGPMDQYGLNSGYTGYGRRSGNWWAEVDIGQWEVGDVIRQPFLCGICFSCSSVSLLCLHTTRSHPF